MKTKPVLRVCLFCFLFFLTTLDLSYATSGAMGEDVLLDKEGLASQMESFQRFAGIALLVGVGVSVYILYKRSK